MNCILNPQFKSIGIYIEAEKEKLPIFIEKLLFIMTKFGSLHYLPSVIADVKMAIPKRRS